MNKLCNDSFRDENCESAEKYAKKYNQTDSEFLQNRNSPKHQNKDRFFSKNPGKIEVLIENNQDTTQKIFISEANVEIQTVQVEESQGFPYIKSSKHYTNIFKPKRKSVPLNKDHSLTICGISTNKRNSML
jgi:hypothetical protein